MTDKHNTPRVIIGQVLHDLASEAETLLLTADAPEDWATGVANNAHPQQLRAMAALVESTALQLGMAAANIVGSAERLRLVAEFVDVADPSGSELPS